MRRFHRLARLLAVPACLAALLAVAAPAVAVPGDWWQFGYTAANTRFNPNETTINEGNVGRLVVGARHSFTPEDEIQHSIGGVVVANGLAYVQAWDENAFPRLLAYRTDSFQSAAVWRNQEGSTCGNRSPTVHLEIVFVASIACRPSSQNGGVFAYDGAGGQLLWSFTFDPAGGVDTVGDAGNVAATNGVVYFRTYDSLLGGDPDRNDNNLWALDARTGAVRWHVQGDLGAYFGDPAIAGGRVFVSAGGRLQARSAATGALLWSRPGAVEAPPAVTGGVVYSTGLENGAWNLFARSVDTGALRWKRALSSNAGLAVAGGRVLAATSAGLRAFDAATGTPRWSVAAAVAGYPAVANGLVYVALQQGIGAWRLSDGAQRWRFDTTVRYGSPVVSGGRLYVSGFTSAGGQPIEVVDQFRL
jgi:outer membrane protein assembly factor BamB